MASFNYRAYDANGRVVTGEVSGPTRAAALDSLRRQGTFPIEITDGPANGPANATDPRNAAGMATPSRGRRQRVSRGALVVLTRELATLVTADLPIDEALGIVALQPMVPAPTRAVAREVLDQVVQGSSLSDALAQHPADFPEFYWRLVAAAERSGGLGPALTELAAHLERRAELGQKVRSALLYPAVLLVAAVVTMAIVTGVLVPSIAPMFEDAGAKLPAVIAALRAAQVFVAEHWMVLLAVLAVTAAGLMRAARLPAVRQALDRFALRLPLAGALIAKSETARFAGTVATLLKSGVPLLDALQVSQSTLGTSVYRSAAGDVAAAVSSGGLLSDALARSGRFPELAVRFAAIGERTGKLDAMLERLGRIEDAAQQRDLERLTGLLAPVLTVTIGVLVGGIILSVMGAIVGLNDLALK
jgi:general secretion pathway protein F